MSEASATRSDALRKLFVEYASLPKQIHHHTEYEKCQKLAAVLRDYLDIKARRLIESAKGMPLMYSYQSDCTSFVTRLRRCGQVHGKQFQRFGQGLSEVLVERGYIVARSSTGKFQSCALLQEPRIMEAGKTTWLLFDAACSFRNLPRTQQHRGICIFHCAFDRGLLSSMSRCLQQRHEAQYVEELNANIDPDYTLLRLLDWFVATGCTLHDASNSLSWSLRPWASEQLLSDLFIVTSSVRKAFGLICEKVPLFVVKYLRWKPQQAHPEEVQRYWQAVGVPSDLLETVAEADPEWGGRQLWVATAIEGRTDSVDTVTNILRALFKYRNICSTRWLSVGLGCRSLAVAMAVGLDQVVAMVMEDSSMSNYYIHGYSRVDVAMRKYIGLVVVTSVLAESVILALLEDGGLCRTVCQVNALTEEEFSFIASLEALTWNRLAVGIGDQGYQGPAMQHDAIHCAITQRAFLEKRFLAPLRELPWSLAIGDIATNLQRLHIGAHADLDSGCSAKIKELMALGWSTANLVCGIELLREIDWTTRSAEQAHGSAAVLHKFHPDVQQEILVARSLLRQGRALFREAQGALQIARMEARCERLATKARAVRTGRNAFFAAVMQAASAQLPKGSRLSQKQRNT